MKALKRLNIEIHEDLLIEIKKRALEYRIPLRKYVLRALITQLKKENLNYPLTC